MTESIYQETLTTSVSRIGTVKQYREDMGYYSQSFGPCTIFKREVNHWDYREITKCDNQLYGNIKSKLTISYSCIFMKCSSFKTWKKGDKTALECFQRWQIRTAEFRKKCVRCDAQDARKTKMEKMRCCSFCQGGITRKPQSHAG